MAIRIAAALTQAANRLADTIAAYAVARREVQRRVDARREADGDAARRAGFSPRLDPQQEAVYQQMLEEGIAEAQAEALDAIDQIDQAVDAEADRVRRAVAQELSPSTSDDVIVEMRRGRLADRLIRILDAEYGRSGSVSGSIDAAVDYATEAENPQETFLVLRSEIPAWVRAHDDVLRTPSYLHRVDQAMRSHLTGDQLQAMETLEELEVGIHRVADAIAQARHAVRRGKMVLNLTGSLPGWNVGHDVRVANRP